MPVPTDPVTVAEKSRVLLRKAIICALTRFPLPRTDGPTSIPMRALGETSMARFADACADAKNCGSRPVFGRSL